MIDTKTQKVAFNTVFQMTGKIISTGLSLWIIFVLTRYLGVAVYGEYTTIFAFVSFASIIADFGFFWVLVRELAKTDEHNNHFFNNLLSLKIVFSLVVFILASAIAFLIPQYSMTVKIGISVIAFGFFWTSLNSTFVGLFQNKLQMYKAVVSDVIGRIIVLVVTLYLVSHNYDLTLILGANVLGAFINFVISYILGAKLINFRFSAHLPTWGSIMRQSFPLAILTLVGTVNFRIDTIILSIMKTQVDVGIYGIPYKILEIIILIPTIFAGNILPIMTRYFHDKDKRLAGSIQKSFDFLMFLGLPVIVGLSILAKPIINFVGGSEYVSTSTLTVLGMSIAAPQILVILAVSIGFAFLTVMFSNLLIVAGKQKSQVIPMTIITIINVIINIIFIPRYSYLAASLANLVSNILLLVWWNKLTHRYIDFRLHLGTFYKIIFVTILMGFITYYLRNINIFLVIFISASVYVFLAYLLKVFDKEMLKRLLPGSLKWKEQ